MCGNGKHLAVRLVRVAAFSARAGFVFKLGKIEKTKDKIEEIKIFHSKIKKDILNLSKNKKKNAKDIEALNKIWSSASEKMYKDSAQSSDGQNQDSGASTDSSESEIKDADYEVVDDKKE